MRPYTALLEIAKGILSGRIVSNFGLSKRDTKKVFPKAPVEDKETGLIWEYKEIGKKKGETVVFPSCHVLTRHETDVVLKAAKKK